jgi:hypothetical protein
MTCTTLSPQKAICQQSAIKQTRGDEVGAKVSQQQGTLKKTRQVIQSRRAAQQWQQAFARHWFHQKKEDAA